MLKNTDIPIQNLVHKLDSVVGNVYQFHYQARTPDGRFKSFNDATPLILNVRRNGKRVWTSQNGRRYMAGINLNYVSESTKTLLIRALGRRRRIVTYNQINAISKIAKSSYRVYRWDYGPSRGVYIDLTKYL
jgi:hypothetical protein